MENTFENALKYVQHLDSIEHTWSESEKTLATAMLSYAAKTSQKSDCISNVSGIYMVHNSGIPISYHKDENIAKIRVKEWHDTDIEAAQKVSYDKIEIE